tara:strand:+ start:673 stop:2367 length:1695 start_codon:yes stop_codon:yes gene_type:complete
MIQMDGSFMDILRKKEESRFTRNNLSDGKKKLLDSEPSFEVEFPEYSFPDSKEELPEVIRIMKEKKIPESEMEDLDKNNNDLLLDIVDQKRSDWIELIKDIDIHTIRLKMKYARPRPYEISEEIESTTDTDDSPSFPSGHAIEAHALAVILGDKFPDKKEELTKMADKISLSRLQMGNHYPSDIEVGEKVGKLIADAYLGVKKSYTISKSERKEIADLLSSLEEKNLGDTAALVRVLDIFSKNNDLKNPRIRLPLQSFIDTFDTRINEITKLVRGLKSKNGFEKLRKRFGGRYFQAFAKYGKGRTDKDAPVFDIRTYNGKKADEVYISLVNEIPGLSGAGGKVSRTRYNRVMRYMNAILDNSLSLSKSRKELNEARTELKGDADLETKVATFNKIKDDLLDTFTEMSIEVADFQELDKDGEINDMEDAIKIGDVAQTGLGPKGIKGFSELSGNLYDSVEYLHDAYFYVEDFIEAIQNIGVEDVLSPELLSFIQNQPGMEIKLPEEKPKEETDNTASEELAKYTKTLVEAKKMFSTMDRLVDDFDGHQFEIGDDKLLVSFDKKTK